MYGALRIDWLIYKAQTINQEYGDKDSKVYDYRITKVELIISGPSTDNALNNSTYISVAKVLKDIEKSYDKGKNLLEEGGKVAQNNRVTKIRFLDNPYPTAVRATPAITLIPIGQADTQRVWRFVQGQTKVYLYKADGTYSPEGGLTITHSGMISFCII